MRDILVDIPYDNPFENDQFERKIIAENFMNIFDADEEGIVLAIDSDWGTGKTTFIKMWEMFIKNDDRYKENYCSIYFNAWDNDYLEDPLLAILTEIKLREKNKEEQVNLAPEIFKEIFNPIYLVAKRGVDIALKLGTSGAIGVDEFKIKEDDTQEKILEKMNEIGNEVLNRCANARNLRNEFKEKLSKFNDNYNKKLIFFIDELDRCRPNFAIELLETIKHLFSVPGIIFVISLDKDQLSHSLATVYGQNMDTVGYLRRFFDLEYKLSTHNKSKYVNVKLSKIFSSYENIKYFQQFIEAFILDYNFSLRDINKLSYYMKIILPIIKEFKMQPYNKMEDIVKQYLYAYLITLKIKEPSMYKKMLEKEYPDNTESIKEIFDINRVNSIKLNLGEDFSITNDIILNKISEEVALNFLELNIKTNEEINEIYMNESEKYLIKLESYNYNYNMMNMFIKSKNLTIISNLEFLNRLTDNI